MNNAQTSNPISSLGLISGGVQPAAAAIAAMLPTTLLFSAGVTSPIDTTYPSKEQKRHSVGNPENHDRNSIEVPGDTVYLMNSSRNSLIAPNMSTHIGGSRLSLTQNKISPRGSLVNVSSDSSSAMLKALPAGVIPPKATSPITQTSPGALAC